MKGTLIKASSYMLTKYSAELDTPSASRRAITYTIYIIVKYLTDFSRSPTNGILHNINIY